MLDSGIIDAEFEVLPDPLPVWVREKLEAATAENWEKVISEVLKE